MRLSFHKESWRPTLLGDEKIYLRSNIFSDTGRSGKCVWGDQPRMQQFEKMSYPVRIWGLGCLPSRISEAQRGLKVRRLQMFKCVGWVVVTSLALYGLAQFLDNHVVTERPSEKPKAG